VKSMHSYWTDEQVEAEVREIFLYARS
jgi:hypothetical protein